MEVVGSIALKMFAALRRRPRGGKKYEKRHKKHHRAIRRQPTYEHIKTIVTGSQPHSKGSNNEDFFDPATLTTDVQDSQERQQEIKFLLSSPVPGKNVPTWKASINSPRPGTSYPNFSKQSGSYRNYVPKALRKDVTGPRKYKRTTLPEYSDLADDHPKTSVSGKSGESKVPKTSLQKDISNDETISKDNLKPSTSYRNGDNQIYENQEKTNDGDSDSSIYDVPLSDEELVGSFKPKKYLFLRPKLERIIGNSQPRYGYWEHVIGEHIDSRHKQLEHYVSQIRLEQKNHPRRSYMPEIPRNVVKFNIDMYEDGFSQDLDNVSYRKSLYTTGHLRLMKF